MNPANSQAALAQLQAKQTTAQNPNDIIANQRQQLGVDAAHDTVTGLRGTISQLTQGLKKVAPSVMGRTGASLVTNAQAQRQISNEQAPISQNISEQGVNLGEADRNYNELNSKAQEAASGVYAGQQNEMSYLQNLYNTLYTREQDAEKARVQEADRQEAIRQFNEQMTNARASTAAQNRQFDLAQDASTAASADAKKQQYASGLNNIRSLGFNDQVAAYNRIKGDATKGDPDAQGLITYIDQFMPGLKTNATKSSYIGPSPTQNNQSLTAKAQRTLGKYSSPYDFIKSLF